MHEAESRGHGFREWAGSRWLVVGLTIVGCTACGAPEGHGVVDPHRFQVWDSAGIRIVETSHQVLDTRVSWRIDPIPSLELGQIEGGDPSQFHRISGIAGLRDGGVVVVDAGSQELRWFDRVGGFVTRFGGEGQGPGEFRDPGLVPQFGGDSLLIFDRRARRFTWVARDGSGYRVEGLPEVSRRSIAGAASAARGSKVLFRTGSSGECLKEYCESSFYVRWVDLTQGTADTIASFPRRLAMVRSPDGLPYGVSGPFDPVAGVAMALCGPVVEGDAPYSLRQYDDDGQLRSIFRVDAPGRDPDDEGIDQAIRRNAARGLDPGVVEGALARMSLPDVVPTFQSVLVDQIGWFWAELLQVNQTGPSTWLLFDPEGHARGLIELPQDLEVHDIGEDYVLGRWRDDLGVEYVRRYGMHRGGE